MRGYGVAGYHRHAAPPGPAIEDDPFFRRIRWSGTEAREICETMGQWRTAILPSEQTNPPPACLPPPRLFR